MYTKSLNKQTRGKKKCTACRTEYANQPPKESPGIINERKEEMRIKEKNKAGVARKGCIGREHE